MLHNLFDLAEENVCLGLKKEKKVLVKVIAQGQINEPSTRKHFSSALI